MAAQSAVASCEGGWTEPGLQALWQLSVRLANISARH